MCSVQISNWAASLSSHFKAKFSCSPQRLGANMSQQLYSVGVVTNVFTRRAFESETVTPISWIQPATASCSAFFFALRDDKSHVFEGISSKYLLFACSKLSGIAETVSLIWFTISKSVLLSACGV